MIDDNDDDVFVVLRHNMCRRVVVFWPGSLVFYSVSPRRCPSFGQSPRRLFSSGLITPSSSSSDSRPLSDLFLYPVIPPWDEEEEEKGVRWGHPFVVPR